MNQAMRMESFKEYPFAEKLRLCQELEKKGAHILNLGIGSPDLIPHPSVIEKLIQGANNPEAHGYQSSRGIPELRMAIASWYANAYGVTLSPETQILPLVGSKEGIYIISLALLNPGDQVLIPNPGYLNYRQAALLAGASPLEYNLVEENSWLPDFAALENQNLSRVRLMWVNYTHMPTGKQGDENLFKDLVAFTQKHDIILINDNPYSLLSDSSPESLLQVEGSSQKCLELNSLSKAFNMAGWRVGTLCGSPSLIDPVYRLSSHFHSGMFLPIQEAAVVALGLEPSWRRDQNAILGQRRIAVNELFQRLGFKVAPQQAGLFVWAKAPKNIEDMNGYLHQLLIENHIFLTPGSFFGSCGERYARASLCVPEKLVQQALATLY